jgi:hypothetical protein
VVTIPVVVNSIGKKAVVENPAKKLVVIGQIRKIGRLHPIERRNNFVLTIPSARSRKKEKRAEHLA